MKKRLPLCCRPPVMLLALLLICGNAFIVPASAGKEVTSTGTIWTAYAESGWSGPFGQQVTGILCGSVCPTSPDSLHHGKIIRKATGWFAQEGQYVAQCKYCSDFFTVFESDLNDAYEEHVEKIQNDYGGTIVGANGVYYLTNWEIEWVELSRGNRTYYLYKYEEYSAFLSFIGGLNHIFFTPEQPGDSRVDVHYYIPFKVTAESIVTATLPSLFVRSGNDFYGFVSLAPENGAGFSFHPAKETSGIGKALPGGSNRMCLGVVLYNAGSPSTFSFDFPTVAVRPVSGFGTDFPVFADNSSRIGNFPGNFSYKGDNGQMITADNVKIVDETNNNYYNPQTGETKAVTDWSYDYSDRSYNLTLEGGDTATVTYGDKNVVIKEGDTTYNIYYIAEGGGEVDPTPSPTPDGHTHDYTAVVTAEPTCIANGVKTYTCSVCGGSYTEKIPATGHTWVVDRTINTTYDENGNVIQQGYTIYKCPACGNEYKDETGTGPPDEGGGEDGGGFLEWLGGKLGELFGAIGEGILSLIQAVLGKFLDGLIYIVEMIAEKLGIVVETILNVFSEIPGIFSGFTDFLGQVFVFFPPEIITIVTFGILMLVLISLVKHFIG